MLGGASVGTLFSLWVLLLALIRGSMWFEKYSMSGWIIIGAYLCGGVLGGAILGLLRPLTRWWWGAAFVGLLVALLVSAVIGLSMYGTTWDRAEFLSIVIPSILLGPGLGVAFWRQNQRQALP